MIPVILSGGSGTRLWPVSRASYPKQFCEFYDQSFLRNTLERVKPLGEPMIVTVSSMSALTNKTLREAGLSEGRAIYEPFGKNTAPAVALLCHRLLQLGEADSIVGVFPADHFIADPEGFRRAVRLAAECAAQDHVVTLGIQPRHAATGYGYIEVTDTVIAGQPSGGETPTALKALEVKGFHEKPSPERAAAFLASGRHYWNAGMFVFKVSVMAQNFQQHMPDLWAQILEIKSDFSNAKFIYANLSSQSLDYGIMEKLARQVCIPCEIGWSDVGSWDEIARLADEQASLKTDVNAKIFNEESTHNYVFSIRNKVVGLVGVSDLIVVDTPDGLLISRRGHTERVKNLVERMKADGYAEATEHLFETRPWGGFEILADDRRYKVKRITVEPTCQLSYQSHAKRAEHWIVVAGTAEVVLNDAVKTLKTGDSIFIPQGAKHRMRNPGTEPLIFVEVQTGSYFGEDDIIRYQDDYNRVDQPTNP